MPISTIPPGVSPIIHGKRYHNQNWREKGHASVQAVWLGDGHRSDQLRRFVPSRVRELGRRKPRVAFGKLEMLVENCWSMQGRGDRFVRGQNFVRFLTSTSGRRTTTTASMLLGMLLVSRVPDTHAPQSVTSSPGPTGSS